MSFLSCLLEIGKGAFQNCVRIDEIKFHVDSKLKKICEFAFCCCKSLKSIYFPSNIEIIESNAFKNCLSMFTYDFRRTKLKNLNDGAVPPSGDITIYFPPTISASSIINNQVGTYLVDESHPYIKKDGCGYYFMSGCSSSGFKDSKHILITRGVEIIAFLCFYMKKLVSITIPTSVKKNSGFAFWKCSKLEKVNFPNDSKLNEIGQNAFEK